MFNWDDLLFKFFDYLKAIALWFVETMLDGLLFMFQMVPVPDFMQNLPSYTLPSSMAYFAQAFELQFGLTTIVTALIIRFIIARLPFIG